MNNTDNNKPHHTRGRILTGIFVVAAGAVFLLRQLGYPLPVWLFEWYTLLIAIGILIGFKSGFRGPGWIIMILVGGIWLAGDILPDFNLQRFTWPLIIIGVGVFIIFRPRNSFDWQECRKRKRRRDEHTSSFQPVENIPPSAFDYDEALESTAIFGNVRKVIVSKNFKGGETVSIFGGHEIDLSQADINGRVELEVVCLFGGTKLIIPSHWDVKSEVAAILAGIEDKRNIPPGSVDPTKQLVLKGTAILGGIEIRNY